MIPVSPRQIPEVPKSRSAQKEREGNITLVFELERFAPPHHVHRTQTFTTHAFFGTCRNGGNYQYSPLSAGARVGTVRSLWMCMGKPRVDEGP